MSESAKPIIHLKEVRKSFASPKGPHVVLDQISLEVFPGEVIALLGPSGSGKSTLLRTINALETIDSGRVEVAGIDLSRSPVPIHRARQNTAMIFQRFELFPHLTAKENVGLALHCVLKKSKSECKQEAEELLASVGLADHAHKYPRALSGGQQQRVAIARALAIRPKVLLCDEPTSALDPELVHEVTDILSGIAGKSMTMLIVTHELAFARRVSTRCFFLDGGKILEAAPTGEFFSSPKSPRLRSFLERVAH